MSAERTDDDDLAYKCERCGSFEFVIRRDYVYECANFDCRLKVYGDEVQDEFDALDKPH